MSIAIDISVGEFLDRLSILELKCRYIKDSHKQRILHRQLNAMLRKKGAVEMRDCELFSDLKNVNRKLWNVENALREKERNKDFGKEFIRTARSVYKLNDKRAKLKQGINIMFSESDSLYEIKSYK